MSNKTTFSRRDFVRSGAVVAAAFSAPADVLALSHEHPSADHALPIRLGLASYTFRNFSRAEIIGFMKQLNVFALNAKDVKDHLPMMSQHELSTLADYAQASIKRYPA